MSEQPKKSLWQIALAIGVEVGKGLHEMAKEDAKRRMEQDRRDAEYAATHKRLRRQGKI